MDNRIQISKYITPVFQTPPKSGSWFGYYNYDPLNHDQTKMLCNRTMFDAQVIKKGMIIDIGYYDIISGNWHKEGESDSWNWPQGCMLQWLPGKGNENKIIYNLSKDGHLISRIHNIVTKEDTDISWPIYGIMPNGCHSIAIDLERSYFSLAYHYESVVNKRKDVRIAKGDGIFDIDLIENKRTCIIPIEEIINTDYDSKFENSKHWLEHIMISPSGQRICFLHRFCPLNDIDKRETRLFVANSDGSNLQIIKDWKRFSWSHFGWDGDDAFSIYTYRQYSLQNSGMLSLFSPSFLYCKSILLLSKFVSFKRRKRILNSLIGQTSYYQYYKLDNNYTFKLASVFKQKEFSIDGHQNFTQNGEYMITDTYPDEHQFQKIIIYNKTKKKPLVIGQFYAGLHKKPGSCDLHPKLCKNNDYLMVDTAYDGTHHLILFKINWILVNQHFEHEEKD